MTLPRPPQTWAGLVCPTRPKREMGTRGTPKGEELTMMSVVKMSAAERETLLVEMFREAEAAAKAADPGPSNDGGSSNLDTPAFRIERVRAAGIHAAAERAGVRTTEFTWLGGQKWFWLQVTMLGQGFRRTKMMEAAQAVLRRWEESGKIPGLVACGYMQAD